WSFTAWVSDCIGSPSAMMIVSTESSVIWKSEGLHAGRAALGASPACEPPADRDRFCFCATLIDPPAPKASRPTVPQARRAHAIAMREHRLLAAGHRARSTAAA